MLGTWKTGSGGDALGLLAYPGLPRAPLVFHQSSCFFEGGVLERQQGSTRATNPFLPCFKINVYSLYLYKCFLIHSFFR